MSRNALREAMATIINEDVTDLESFHTRPTKVILPSSQPAATVHISRMHEYREANLRKLRTYTVHLIVDFFSPKPRSEDAQDDFDALMDQLEGILRSNKTVTAPDGTIFIRLGEPDVTSAHTLPVLYKDGAGVQIHGLISFEADEQVEPA